MTPGTRLMRRVLVGAAGTVLAAGVAAPFLNAARFQKQIREGLERGLQRKVEIAGEIHFTLFTGPGFTVDDVLIAEDPRMGIEPFAYVSSLRARIRLRSLWTGKLEFSNLRLDEPSVNLVQAAGGPWNIQPFLARAVGATRSGDPEPMPDIQVRGARLNFKFGDVKSVYYLANADVDVAALSEEGDSFSIRFEGEPARTDRAAQNFGRVAGRGRWTQNQGRESEIELNARWEKSPLAEFLTLLFGQDAGIHGLIAAQVTLAGPVSNIQVSGRAQVEDVHRWDLMPPRSEGWPLAIRGKLDLRQESLDVEMAPEQGQSIGARFRLTRMLSSPQFGAILSVRQMPLPPVIEIARHMGAPIAPQLEFKGSFSGALGYSSQEGFKGALTLSEASASAAKSEPVRCERAEVVVEHSRWQLLPAQMLLGRGQTAVLQAEYEAGGKRLDLQLTTKGLAFAEMQSRTAGLLGAGAVPLLEQLQEGRWRGSLRYRLSDRGPGTWSGNAELGNARIQLPGMSDPVRIAAAKVLISGHEVSMSGLRGGVAETEFQGEYRYQPGAARPHRFSIRTGAISVRELERLFKPTLRRRQGFLARTLRFQAPLPDWLKDRHAEGSLRVGTLSLGEHELGDFQGRLVWDSTRVELNNVTATLEEGELKATLAVDLSRSSPSYLARGRIESASWQGGELDVEGRIRASGTDAEIFSSLRSEGCLSGRWVTLAPDTVFAKLSGCFDFAAGKSSRLALSKVEAVIGAETYSGQADWQGEGRIGLEFTGGKKPVRLAGTIAPWRMEATR